VAVDAAGNLYIADSFNYRIRKVDTSGKISTFAGNGTPGYSGDGGTATSAKINQIKGISVNSSSNVFITDFGSHCVRKITNGIITTVAGIGTNGFSGDGSLATNANLAYPYSTVSDSIGNLYIADAGNNRIRKLGTNGLISTVVGKMIPSSVPATNATLNLTWGLAKDFQGNLFLADFQNNVIRKLDANGMLTIVAGNGSAAFSGDGGAATNASLNAPTGVALDSAGNIFIADWNNQRVRKVDTNGNINTVAGTGNAGYSSDNVAATNSKLNQPYSVVVDGLGNVFIADSSNSRVRKVDTNGIITTVGGNGNYSYSFSFPSSGVAATATSVTPYALALNNAGNLYVGDASSSIRRITNGIIRTVANQSGLFGFSGDGGQALSASMSTVFGITFDSTGNLFLSDVQNNRIRKIGTNGIITTIAGQTISGYSGDNGSGNLASTSTPHGVAVDAAGNVYFADTGNNRIRKVAYVDYADQPTFTVTNVALASVSNNYSVIITSASGSVTSSVATVNVQLPPITPAFTASNGIYSLSWSAVSNLTYQLQYATNLITPTWFDLGSPVTATNNSVSTTDASGADTQRFYRVRLWP
jgi:sugar lactone lactonase YvrE